MILAKILTIGAALLAALGGASPTTTANQARKDFASSVDFCSWNLNRQNLHAPWEYINPEEYMSRLKNLDDAIALSRQVSPDCGKDQYDGCVKEYVSLLNQLDPDKKSYVTRELRKCVAEDFRLQYYPQ